MINIVLTIGSLFSGIGGIELGFEWAGGFKTIWFCENDKYAQAVLKKHWPGVPIYGDITKVDWTMVEKPDILTGGFPCQDISISNWNRKGLNGKRSGLWSYYFKAICVLRPKIAVIENVPEIVRQGLHTVLENLAEAGYNAEWFTLQAQDFGAPHKRERMFIIAFSGSIPWRSDITTYSQDGFQRNRQWTATQDFKTRKEWKRWLVEASQAMDGEISKSDFFGMDDGISKEMDRIKCLGNSVVPQCAQIVAERVKELVRNA